MATKPPTSIVYDPIKIQELKKKSPIESEDPPASREQTSKNNSAVPWCLAAARGS